MNTVLRSLALFFSLMLVLAACTGAPAEDGEAMMEKEGGEAMMEKEASASADGTVMMEKEGVAAEGTVMMEKEAEGMMKKDN